MYELGSKVVDWFKVYQKVVCIATKDFDRNLKCNWEILEISEAGFCLGFDLETCPQIEWLYLYVWSNRDGYQNPRIKHVFGKVWFLGLKP